MSEIEAFEVAVDIIMPACSSKPMAKSEALRLPFLAMREWSDRWVGQG